MTRLKLVVLFCLSSGFFLQTTLSKDYAKYLPRQVHLSYPGSETMMYVTWTTEAKGSANSNRVNYWPKNKGDLLNFAFANVTRFDHWNETTKLNTTVYVYRALMSGLKPQTSYTYQVETEGVDGVQFEFETFNDETIKDKKICILGDLGLINPLSLETLKEKTNKKEFGLVIHNGDIAYDLNKRNGALGDDFMKMIEPIAARVPYNFVAGNHEKFNNFSEFSGRFTSNGPSVFYHSFNVGPIHFVILNDEYYIYDNFGTGQLVAQYNWLEEDLGRANLPESRAQQPWIITLAHEPMYCSDKPVTHPCNYANNSIRAGYKGQYVLEDLFFKHGVDLQFYAHQHNYQRMFPIYRGNYQQFDDVSIINDPKYPIHVTSGEAGNRGWETWFTDEKPDWVAFRSQEFGFVELSVVSRLELKLEKYSVTSNKYIDSFIVKKSTDSPSFDYSVASSSYSYSLELKAISTMLIVAKILFNISN